MQLTYRLLTIAAALLMHACAAVDSNDTGGTRFKRDDVFEFTQKPACRKTATDRYEIHFAVKGACDVAVGIVDHDGKIVRHLAAGVLGANAPEPLQKNSLEQKLVWD